MQRLCIVVLSAFLFFSVTSCTPEQTEQEVKAQAASIKQGEIQLDENMPGAKVSTARNIYFVFDGSGSMEEAFVSDRSFPSKLDGAKWAVREFMKNVPPDVNLGLYVFDARGQREVIRLGPGNKEAFQGEVASITANHGTPLGEAIMFGTDRLVEQYKKQLGYGDYRLVVVTDGMANGAVSVQHACAYATERKIPAYTISLDIDKASHPLSFWSKSFMEAKSAQDLKRGLEESMAELPAFDPAEFKE